MPITGIAGDQQAALYGQNCINPGDTKCTYGTGCFAMVNTGNNRLKSNHNLLTTIAYQLAGQPIYALEGSVFSAGVAVKWLRDNLGLIKTVEETEAWKINFFEGIPSPAAAGLILLPLILNLSGLIELTNTAIISSIVLLLTSFLMVSKIPTYSLKRILIPRKLAIFLLLGIGIYLSLIIFYTFETLFITGLIYILLIPLSFFHYRYINKKYKIAIRDEEETEDVL